MRVLFTTWNAPSHLFPSVPLARAFAAAGHDVRVAAPRNCTMAIAAAGLRPEPVGVDIDIAATSAAGNLASWHRQASWPADWVAHVRDLGEAQRGILRALGGKQIRIAEAMVDDLVQVARTTEPDLVVHDAGTYAGRVAATAIGVPSISHLWGSPAIMRLERRDLDGEPLPGYSELFTRRHLRPETDSTVWLDPCPPALQVPSATLRTPVRPVPYNGAGAAPDWAAEPLSGRPRVAITWGVTAAKLQATELPPLLVHAVTATAATGAEVVLAVPRSHGPLVRAALSGTAPHLFDRGREAVRIVEDVPLRHLLPSCTAVVHQGGGGTTMTAVAHGVPQLIVSPRPEQMITGHRVTAYGAGRHRVANELAARTDIGDALAEDLTALLEDPGVTEAAQRLADDAAALPAPAEVVEQLATLATDFTLSTTG